NTRGFYTPLQGFMEQVIGERFMNTDHLAMWSLVDDPESGLAAIQATPRWREDARDDAVERRRIAQTSKAPSSAYGTVHRNGRRKSSACGAGHLVTCSALASGRRTFSRKGRRKSSACGAGHVLPQREKKSSASGPGLSR